ncbi:hypothetical protein ABZ601_04785 [Streptomyces sp. NPDC012842]|uniref:hypothetical protein n=1 Tax=Streptomyces TaxID=1883 RepID=UPI0033C98952
MALTWGLGYSGMPSWEITTESIRRQGLLSMKAQQEYLLRVWSREKLRLRREVYRRTHASPLNIKLPAPRTSRTSKLFNQGYVVLAKGLDVYACDHKEPEAWRSLEEMARNSLARAVDAFNFLEDTDLSELAHLHAHKVAALVGGVFGCNVECSDGSYWDICQLSLMHRRCGMSAGFTATRRCSLCNDDIDLCAHLLDTLYEVQVQRGSDGRCNVCGRDSCPHADGEAVLAYPHPVMSDFELHEVSLVRRPRDPLARISKLELDPDLLARTLGGSPDGRDVSCYRCLHPCEGFTSIPMEIC